MRKLAWMAVLVSGCYHPQALDARAVLDELSAEQRIFEPSSDAPRAEGEVSDGRMLAEREAVDLALKWNPELRVLRRQRGIAEGEVIAAGALANPTVGLQWSHVQEVGEKPAVWAVQLGWEPPQPVVLAAKRSAAKAGAEGVNLDIAEREWQLATDVRVAHAHLLALTTQRALLDQALDMRRRIAELVEKRAAAGASTRIELSLAQLARSEMERERDELASQELAAGQQLAALVGASRPVGATGALPESIEAPAALEALEQLALDHRPAIEGAKARYRQREEIVRLEHARQWPWFKLTAAPKYRANTSESRPNDFQLGLEFTLPILDQNRGPVLSAESSRDQQRDAFRGLLETLRRDVKTSREEIALRQNTLKRYREQILPSLEEQERLLATASSGGQLDVVALLTAEDALLRHRREYSGLLLAHYLAWIQLERAVGSRLTGEGAK